MEIKSNFKAMLFPKVGKYIVIFIFIAAIIAGVRGYQLYRGVFEDNVKNNASFFVSEGMSYDMLIDSLRKYEVLKNEKTFYWVAKKKNCFERMKPGKYAFKIGQSSNELVNMLIAGNQVAVEVTFNNLRFMSDLASKVATDLQPDSGALLAYLNDPSVWEKYGFNEHTFHAMFIPNTYQMYWTSTPEQFVERMYKEYNRFWNGSRLKKAQDLNLTPVQVITLASIVQEETIKPDEKPIVAGLYLNRIRKGMLLQADPTVKYAVGDFSLKRILLKHLSIESPYNTYKYVGLPPGPINFPEISSIDAVLNAENHTYLYMCAKGDFSGYHNFATTLRQHNNNARIYREELDKRSIY